MLPHLSKEACVDDDILPRHTPCRHSKLLPRLNVHSRLQQPGTSGGGAIKSALCRVEGGRDSTGVANLAAPTNKGPARACDGYTQGRTVAVLSLGEQRERELTAMTVLLAANRAVVSDPMMMEAFLMGLSPAVMITDDTCGVREHRGGVKQCALAC